MARIVCRACGYEGDGDVDGAPRCPRCSSSDVRAAVRLDVYPGPMPFVWYHDDVLGRVRMREDGVIERLVVVDGQDVVVERIASDKRYHADLDWPSTKIIVPIAPIRTATTPDVVEVFIAHGHTPKLVRQDDGDMLVVEERRDDGVGLRCVRCGHFHDAVHYTVATIHACDGAAGLARHLRREARLAKLRWEKAEAAAREAEVAAGSPSR